jgi:hypothetical protein
MVPTRKVQYEFEATMDTSLSWICAVDVLNFKSVI